MWLQAVVYSTLPHCHRHGGRGDLPLQMSVTFTVKTKAALLYPFKGPRTPGLLIDCFIAFHIPCYC